MCEYHVAVSILDCKIREPKNMTSLSTHDLRRAAATSELNDMAEKVVTSLFLAFPPNSEKLSKSLADVSLNSNQERVLVATCLTFAIDCAVHMGESGARESAGYFGIVQARIEKMMGDKIPVLRNNCAGLFELVECCDEAARRFASDALIFKDVADRAGTLAGKIFASDQRIKNERQETAGAW